MLRRLSVDGLADVAVTATVQVDIEDPRGTPYGVSAFMEPAAPATGEAWVPLVVVAGSSTHSWFTWASTVQPGSLFVVTDAQAARNQYYAVVRGRAPGADRGSCRVAGRPRRRPVAG